MTLKLKKRRTEIAFELDQIMVIKRRSGSVSGWCSGCEVEVLMLTPDEATSIVRVNTRALFRMMDADKIHFAETSAGLIRLCLPSLLQAIGAATQSDNQLSPEKVGSVRGEH